MESPVHKQVLFLALLLLAPSPARAEQGSDVQEEEYEQTDQQGEVSQGDSQKQDGDEEQADDDEDGDDAKDIAQLNAEQAKQGERMRIASSTMVRRFHEVLDELLAEFGYDVKMGQIKGLANLAIRKVRVSNAIPRTYEEYVDMLLTERIRENSRVKLIACVPCKTRTSSLEGGRLVVTSPATNLARLEAAAATLGIENFMDAVLVYHTTHMVLAVSVFNSQTKELVWARTYNSETVKSRYQKLAIDYSQVKKTEPGEDYSPEYRFMFGAGGASMPNVGGDSKDRSMMAVQVRATEKFNNRRTEFGMMLAGLKTAGSLVKEYPSEEPPADPNAPTEPATPEADPNGKAKPKPFQTALGLYALYGHVFLGAVESYNEVRHGVHLGIGALAATGYLAPTLRVGYDMFFGRRFVTSLSPSYVAPSSVLVDGETVETKGGAGVDVIMSLNF
jgi:hypothetical protein